ncbi:hypothetical protein [Clostridium luticellarii]|jgi:lipopolysaccharide export LptBFGC system permease protein LptF|uniref:Uncharacterized protein n=2 Tax=Clostridium luticellarii TaxID=1691940 RepID=A0A2T0BM80_9CLOT|nr:hypothetical protein [Clostridium luticellarii]MCI1945047.1 hypothetical protein [Clostridium luticellarii]PRR84985.1 hypothetical protein CLLU_20390 [Clostridium luticellarii]
MKYMLCFLILCSGYYTFSYGISLWVRENNGLAAFGVWLLAVVSTLVPIIMLMSD